MDGADGSAGAIGRGALPRGVHRVRDEGVSRIVSAGAWLFGSTVLAGLVLRPWVGDELFVTRYTGYVMPWLLGGLLPAAVWAWARRSRALAAVLSGAAAIILARQLPVVRWHAATASPSPATLRVMSYNTWSRNDDADRIAHVILDQRPDLVLLQEIWPEVFDRLVERLRDLYGGAPVHSAYEGAVQQGVIGRHPIESSASMRDKGQAQRVVLHLPGGPITVFNVHPLRRGGWRSRYEEIASLLEQDVLRETAPVILAGDFNAPERSELYDRISANLKNAHREAGSGLGFTYPAPALRVLRLLSAPSVVRIDHIFYSDHFVALRAGTVQDSGGSDHRPVLAELDLRPR
jgi:vancomycin resistance protein VanJ